MKALEDEERPAVRVRALTALREALSESQMIEYMDLHSFTLDIRIKVLTFLSRLEFVGLVYKVRCLKSSSFSSLFLNEYAISNRKRNSKLLIKRISSVVFFRVEGVLSAASLLQWIWLPTT